MDKDKRERVINEWIQGCYEARTNEELTPSDELICATEAIMDTISDDPESAWHLVLDIIKRDSSEMILFDVGAGPLEDLLNDHPERFIDRVEIEARINQTFRIALSGVWQREIPDGIWTRIRAATRNPVTH